MIYGASMSRLVGSRATRSLMPLLFVGASCGDPASATSASTPDAGRAVADATSAGEAKAPGEGASGDASRTPRTGAFELAWEDNFDAFDAARWQLMTHTWDGNLAQFSTENTKFENGMLSLLLTSMPTDALKPFRGAEMRSIQTLTYGKVETRARFAKGSGVVSALVLIYTPWPADDWNELDIEYLGRYSDKIQLNAMVYTGAPKSKPVQTSVSPTQDPELAPLTLDPAGDFHVYGIEWTPNDARFTVDGELKRVWSKHIDRMKLPQNILLTIWASSSVSWAGAIATDTAPTQADFDWVRVYEWKPSGD